MTIAFDLGVEARTSDNSEPSCPYEPGTEKYKQFAEGFCSIKFEGILDRLKEIGGVHAPH